MKIKLFLIVLFTLNIYISDIVFAESNPNILSEAAILIDSKTGEVLYEKNAHAKMYPASLTKIATAIYALEKGDLNDVVTVSKNARQVDGSRVYLEEGEKVQLRKLIQGLLINSGNDAGVAIAEHLDGSIETFATKLNSYLSKLGVENTNFENSHGLFNPKHVTTAEDLAKITQYAMKNEEFREIFGTKELEWKGTSWQTTIYTHHKLMRENPYDGVTGGKTGYIPQSGNTLVTTANRNELSLIAVILKGSNQQMTYKDTVELLDYGFNHFKTSYIPKGTMFPVKGEKFLTTKDFYYTQSSNENVIKNVNENGMLEIVNENQEIIASLQLKDVQEKSEGLSKKQVETESGGSLKGNGYLFGFLLITFSILSLFYIRAKIRRKRNKKFRPNHHVGPAKYGRTIRFK